MVCCTLLNRPSPFLGMLHVSPARHPIGSNASWRVVCACQQHDMHRCALWVGEPACHRDCDTQERSMMFMFCWWASGPNGHDSPSRVSDNCTVLNPTTPHQPVHTPTVQGQAEQVQPDTCLSYKDQGAEHPLWKKGPVTHLIPSASPPGQRFHWPPSIPLPSRLQRRPLPQQPPHPPPGPPAAPTGPSH